MSKTHKVEEGECIASIAYDHGFFPATVWSHPDNAALRETRKLGTVLQPGDSVFIPDLRPKQVEIAIGVQHRFRRKGVPETLRMRFVDRAGQPRASARYEIEIDGVVRAGATDADGSLREFIPPSARSGTLTLTGERGRPERYALRLGRLAPATEPAGVRARLEQLGYACGGEDAIPVALRLFQQDHGLAVTGERDPDTLARLVKVFGA